MMRLYNEHLLRISSNCVFVLYTREKKKTQIQTHVCPYAHGKFTEMLNSNSKMHYTKFIG